VGARIVLELDLEDDARRALFGDTRELSVLLLRHDPVLFRLNSRRGQLSLLASEPLLLAALLLLLLEPLLLQP